MWRKAGGAGFRQSGPGWCLENSMHQTPRTGSTNTSLIIQRWNPVWYLCFVLIWCLLVWDRTSDSPGWPWTPDPPALPSVPGLYICATMLDLVSVLRNVWKATVANVQKAGRKEGQDVAKNGGRGGNTIESWSCVIWQQYMTSLTLRFHTYNLYRTTFLTHGRLLWLLF